MTEGLIYNKIRSWLMMDTSTDARLKLIFAEARQDYPDEHNPEYWELGIFLEGKFYEDVEKWAIKWVGGSQP